MDEILNMAYKQAINFREKYQLGNYCAKQLLEIIKQLQRFERMKIKVIRTQFDNINISGFIGYKNETYIIVANTNHSLGSERFTIAHEIYHLLTDRVKIKNKSILKELNSNNNSCEKEQDEIMANAFAAELLIPEKDLLNSIELSTTNNKEITKSTVIQLQQKYGVSYISITKRLSEIVIINCEKQNALENFSKEEDDLITLTKKLGYNNELNIPSKDFYLLQSDLENIRQNYENKNITYDDLIRIFGYLKASPEDFGYENNVKVTDEGLEFIKSLMN